ncbi:MAG: DUF4131 domain-containing protein [Candidatus Nealsonbacteria bacterium]|nr:DUF4131 domain-containing protein [Candidatus Nealsonbacteria bacterium]
MTSSKLLLFLSLSFIGGIFLESFFELSFFIPFLLVLLGFLFFLSFWKAKAILPIFCFLFLLLGAWRYQSGVSLLEGNKLFPLIGEDVVLSGVVDSYPDRRESTTKLTIKIDNFKEKILVTSWKYPSFNYGDRLEIRGKIQKPEPFEGFDYPAYLAKEGIYGVMYYPDIKLKEEGQGNPLFASLFSFKDTLKKGIGRVLPMPHAGLLEALIFGDEENIPASWKEKFNFTGTRHIAAVSGMNITIISFLILNCLLWLGFWRRQAFYISVALMFAYILTIGAPASGVRAVIMGILLLAAQNFGRISNGIRPVVFSAFLMLLFNPLLLEADVGFQLSFLAILGLAFWQPVFSRWLSKIPDFFQIRYTVSATLAAQVFTLPVLIYHFHQASLLGSFSNILIVPLLPFVTILGFFLALAATLFFPSAFLLLFPVWAGLAFILGTVDFFYKIPTLSLRIGHFSFGWLMLTYTFLGLVTWKAQESQKVHFLLPDVLNKKVGRKYDSPKG